MEREIKFRGLDINGKWYYGNVSILKQNVHDVKQGSYISNSVGCPFAYQVRPETVGQFTGLLDKNGKEIYEGDVVYYEDLGSDYPNKLKKTVIIEWGNVGWKYLDIYTKFEIIGNVWEHPELLKGEITNGQKPDCEDTETI